MSDLPILAGPTPTLTFDSSNQSQTSSGNGSSTQPLGESNQIQPNPLDVFSSFNNLFTLACLTPDQQNNGVMDKSALTNIVCRSQGDWGKDRADKRVQTDFGSFDYFIDDVIIVSIPAASKLTGNSFATKISFKVIEPYSMGLFLLTLQQGAHKAGYGNFKEAAYMFMMEFVGWDDDESYGAEEKSDTTRYIPIKFINIKFKVTASGSVYECEAIPYNEAAFRDNTVKVTTDVKITGSTVKEILADSGSKTSLVNQLFQKYQNDKNVENGDLFVILFPESWDQPTGSDNIISKSILYENLDANGTVPFKDMKDTWIDGKEITQSSALQIDEKRNWHFTQEVTITEVITEVVLRSHYITDQITGSTFKTDDNGMVNWFRIEAQVIDNDFNKQLGRQSRSYYYRVLPYKVHIHKFLPPDIKPPGYDNLKKNIAKKYDYIYTGLNTEVLNLDIQFDMAFFAPLPSDYTENVGQENWGQGSITASGQDSYYNIPPTSKAGTIDLSSAAESVGIPQSPTDSFASSLYTSGSLTSQSIQRFLTTGSTQQATGQQDWTSSVTQTSLREFQFKPRGGSGSDYSKTSQVRTYQALLENDADMVQINLDIMGDPYYIPSSGMGNQSVERENFNLLKDGSMNYQEGEVDIIINFRTPIDLDPDTGLYKFAKTIDMWSGLYQVIEVESKFNNNKFTQRLRANRLRVQVGGSDQQLPAIVEEGAQGGAGDTYTGTTPQSSADQTGETPSTGSTPTTPPTEATPITPTG